MLRFIGRIFNINLHYSWNCDHCNAGNVTWKPLGVKFPETVKCYRCHVDNEME